MAHLNLNECGELSKIETECNENEEMKYRSEKRDHDNILKCHNIAND